MPEKAIKIAANHLQAGGPGDASHNHNSRVASRRTASTQRSISYFSRRGKAPIGRRGMRVVPCGRSVKSSTAPADLTLRPPDTSGTS